MGKMANKLKKSIMKSADVSVAAKPKCGVSKEDYDNIYFMVREKLKNEIRDEVMAKVSKNVIPKLKEELRKEVAQEATNDAYGHLIALTCNILLNDFGKLNRKDTRLKVFYELLQEMYGEIENPSQRQLDAEKELNRQIGRLEIVRE